MFRRKLFVGCTVVLKIDKKIKVKWFWMWRVLILRRQLFVGCTIGVH